MKKHDELVEEIAKKLWAIQAFPGATDWDRAIEKAESIVILILSAVRDGRLDEELGVAGRAKGYADTKGYDSGFRGQADVELVIDEHDVSKRGISDGDRLEFIVLSGTS